MGEKNPPLYAVSTTQKGDKVGDKVVDYYAVFDSAIAMRLGSIPIHSRSAF